MSIKFPESRREVVERTLTDILSELPSGDPFRPRSFLRAIGVGSAGRNFEFYLQLKELIKQMFPNTAEDDFAIMWGALVKIFPNPATQAHGLIIALGSAGIIIAKDALFTNSASKQYKNLVEATTAVNSQNIASLTRSGTLATAETASEHHLATGMQVTISGAVQTQYNGNFTIVVTSTTEFTYTVTGDPATPATGSPVVSYTGALLSVQSVDFGESANQVSGESLTIVTPLAGLSNNAIVTFAGIGGGTDIESFEGLRKRYIYRYQNPHALFNEAEVTTEAKKVPGVTRVWIQRATPIAGKATVYFVRDNDEDIIPTPSEVKDVKDKLVALLPIEMTAERLFVFAPTPHIVDFNLSALEPNTTAMREAIKSSLEAFFRDNTNISENIKEDGYRAAIYQTIDATGAKVKSFTLSSPTGDITIAAGELGIFGDLF